MATNMFATAYFTTVVIDIRIWVTFTSSSLPTESSTALMTLTHRQAPCEDKKYFQNIFDFILNALLPILYCIFLCNIFILPKTRPVKYVTT